MRVLHSFIRLTYVFALLALLPSVQATSASGEGSAQRVVPESVPGRMHVRLRFVDPFDVPLAGVQMRWNPDVNEDSDALLGISSPQGTCEFDLDLDPDRHWVSAWTVASGRATTWITAKLEAGPFTDLGTIRLAPGGTIRGVVRDGNGQALSGARVVLADTKDGEPILTRTTDAWPGKGAPLAFARTDEDGTFRLLGAPVGSFSVWARHESTHWQGRSRIVVEAERETEVATFALEALPAERILEGHVLAPDGTPVVGAHVETSVSNPATRGQHLGGFSVRCDARTDARGHFRIYLAFPPDRALSLTAEDPSSRFAEAYLEATAGARDIEIRLLAQNELTLVVLDMLGQPIERFGWGLGVDHGKTYVSTGAEASLHPGGRAKLTIPAAPFTITIRAPGYDDLELGPFASGEAPNPLEFRLRVLPTARGTVLFDGRPVSGASVELVLNDVHDLGELVPGFELGTFYGFENARTVTDEQGRFAIPDDYPHLDWHARAWKDGYGESSPVRARIGGDAVTLELRKASALRGTVKPAGGMAPQELRLELCRTRGESVHNDWSDDRTRRLRATPAADGSYAFDSLASGTWLLFVRGPRENDPTLETMNDAPPFVVRLDEGETERFDIDLSKDTLLELDGRLDVDGSPVQGLVSLYAIGEPWVLACEPRFSAPDGHFRIAVRQPGTYRLVVRDSGSNGRGGKSWTRIALDVVEMTGAETEWRRSVDAATWKQGGVRFAFR